jgi:hypothetical protein
VVAADPTGGDDHRLGAQREVLDLAARTGDAAGHVAQLEHLAAHAVHHAARDGQLVHPVPEPELHQSLGGGFADPALERRDQSRPGAPGDVEPRHRVAVAVGVVAAALGPADHGEEPNALGVQPRALLAGREVDVRLGPLAGPTVLVIQPVEAGRAEPVLPGEVAGVLDPHPPLFGGIDEHQPAERPECLPAERRLRLLVEQQHLLARIGQFGGGGQPGQPRSDDDHVSVHQSIPSVRSSMYSGHQPAMDGNAQTCKNRRCDDPFRARAGVTYRFLRP